MFIPGRYSTAAATAAATAAVAAAPANNINVEYSNETANKANGLQMLSNSQEDQCLWHRNNFLQHPLSYNRNNGMKSVQQQQVFVQEQQQQPLMPSIKVVNMTRNGAIPKQQSTARGLVYEQAAISIKADKIPRQMERKPSTSNSAFTMIPPAVEGSVNANSSHTLRAQTKWDISDEGGSNIPGAASINYSTYELEQKRQQNDKEEGKKHQQLLLNIKDNNFLDENTFESNSLKAANTIDQPNSYNTHYSNNLEDDLHNMSTVQLYNILQNYDALQEKYHTVLLLPKESKREVTAGGRDGSAYVLRCLKIWYELPSDVLFSAMSLVDRFLDRMAVKPKHMACMSVASFYLAIKQLNLKLIPAEDLVTISQCGCTAGDLERMANVIANKLGVQMGQPPITSVSYLRIYYALFYNFAKNIGGQFYEFYKHLIKLEELENRLEILLCDVKTTVLTSSTLALVLICLHLDCHIKESYTRGSPELKHVFEYILFLQQYVKIPDRVFTCGFGTVAGILSHYNGQNKQPYKQRLVWKLSSRTLRILRPMNRFSSDLPTIKEGNGNSSDESSRFRSESVSSEEEEDWPTSHIIPIFE